MEARYMTDLEWRICHAVNIYVYKNGRDGEQPILVHIPPAKKKNMKTVLNAIQERVKYPVGYAAHLYKMDGKKIRHPCELEMYNNYVVASNYDKHFKCAQYGRKRSPLLVLNRDSKHVRVLRLQNQNYHEWILKKKAVGEERPQYIYPTFYTNENARAQDLPVGQMGNYQPPGQMGGGPGCCKRPEVSGGKTYRVNPEQQGQGNNKPSQQEFAANNFTTEVNHNEAIKAIHKLEANHEAKRMKQTHKSTKKVAFSKSDAENANITTAEEGTAAEVVTIADSQTSLSEETRTSATYTQGTSSSEDIDRKYKEMVKKARRKEKKKKDKEIETNNSKPNPLISHGKSKNNQNRTKSKIPVPYNQNREDRESNNNNKANGDQMLVLPPPPHPFRDSKGFLINDKDDSNTSLQNSLNTSWSPEQSNTTIDIPFIPQDNQAGLQQQSNFIPYAFMGPSPVQQGVLQAQAVQGGMHLHPYDQTPRFGQNNGEEFNINNNNSTFNPLLQQHAMGHQGIPMQPGQQMFSFPAGFMAYQGQVDQGQQNLETFIPQRQKEVSNCDNRKIDPKQNSHVKTTSTSSQTMADRPKSNRNSNNNNSNVIDSEMQRPFQTRIGMQPQFWLMSGQQGVTGLQQHPGVQGYNMQIPVGNNNNSQLYTVGHVQQSSPLAAINDANNVQQKNKNINNPYKVKEVRKRSEATAEEKSEVEVDIPYTPMMKTARTYRVQPEKSFVNRTSTKFEVSPARSRNVAIQMGHPSQEDRLTQPLKGPRPQHSQRQQIIPVKIAYSTAGGETHLNNGYIFPDETQDLLPSPRKCIGRSDLHQKRLPIQSFPTPKLYKQTSNAATQVNHGFPNLRNSPNSFTKRLIYDGEKPEENNTIQQQDEASNPVLEEYFVSRMQESNSDPHMEDLANIPPPTAFRESLRISNRIRDFQNVSGNFNNTPMDFSPRSNCYYY